MELEETEVVATPGQEKTRERTKTGSMEERQEKKRLHY